MVEGPKAGGHPGVKPEDIDNPAYSLETVIPNRGSHEGFEDRKGRAIPVIAAGGVYSGADIKRFLDLGASGVQMGTRFVATHECDADIRFKQSIVDAGSDDITIIRSPVGLPWPGHQKPLSGSAGRRQENFRCIFHCISTCDPKSSPYCIAAALLNAMKGNLEKGFTFTGANAFRVDSIVSVRELMGGLQKEFDAALTDARAKFAKHCQNTQRLRRPYTAGVAGVLPVPRTEGLVAYSFRDRNAV